jgi:hypothetical protein
VDHRTILKSAITPERRRSATTTFNRAVDAHVLLLPVLNRQAVQHAELLLLLDGALSALPVPANVKVEQSDAPPLVVPHRDRHH